MAFEKLVTAPKYVLFASPATVSLTKRGKAKLPSLNIGLNKDLLAKTSFANNDPVSLLIGTGEDAGVARIVGDVDGALHIVVTGNGGGVIHAGKTTQFGDQVRERAGCAADVIDEDTIEITLPPWALEG